MSTVTETSTPAELKVELADLTHLAAVTKPSPMWDDLHDEINQILDWLVGR